VIDQDKSIRQLKDVQRQLQAQNLLLARQVELLEKKESSTNTKP
jgi:hypothetical protein